MGRSEVQGSNSRTNLNYTKRERHNNEAMPAWTLSHFTWSVSYVGEPGLPDKKGATGTRHTWSRAENLTLLKCYYVSKPRERGYLGSMWKLWKILKPIIQTDSQTTLDWMLQQSREKSAITHSNWQGITKILWQGIPQDNRSGGIYHHPHHQSMGTKPRECRVAKYSYWHHHGDQWSGTHHSNSDPLLTWI